MFKGMKVICAMVIAVCGFFTLPVSAEPTHQALLTVSGYSGTTPLVNFPVLVRLSPQTIQGFDGATCAPDGSDLLFVNDQGDNYPYEIDTWNPSGESLVWVNLPRVENGVTFFVQWGGGAVAAGASVASRTWNNDYVGVWHMGEQDGVCANSTRRGSAYDATPKGATNESVLYAGADAPIGGARTTATSTSAYLSVPSYNTLGLGGVFTVSGWVRFSAASGYARLFSRKTTYTGPGWEIEMNNGSTTTFNARGCAASPQVQSSFPDLLQNWVHVSFVYNDTILSVYGNGKLLTSGAITAAADNDLPLSIGNNSNGDEAFVKGAFDECRLMGGAASADWVKAEYDTVATPGFLIYGAAEAIGASGPTLRLGALQAFNTADSFVDFFVYVLGLGEGATAATLTLAYGYDAASLDLTHEVGLITASGRTDFRLSRLLPARTYFVQLTVHNNLGQTAQSGILRVKTNPSSDVSSLPGLYQTFFTSANAKWEKDYADLPEGTDWLNYQDNNRIYRRELGVLAAYVGGNPKATKIRSEVWGDEVYWPVNGGQWVYWGRMRLEVGKSYRFRMKIDDNERVMITDPFSGRSTVLLEDKNNKNTIFTSDSFKPSRTGWYPIEIRLSDGGSGAGGYTTTDNYRNTENMGWSDDDGGTWHLLMDPGDGSLLMAKGDANFTIQEVVSGGSLRLLSLTFDAAPASRDLYVVWGPVSGGKTPTEWANREKVATIEAGQTESSYQMPSNWGTDENLVLSFYFDDSIPSWSSIVYWRDVSDPDVSLDALNGRGGDTLKVTGTLGNFVGDSCTLKVLVGSSESEMNQVWTGLADSVRTASGTFELMLFEPVTASSKYIRPGETYYVCVEATANGRRARTPAAKVTMARNPTFGSSSASVSRRTVTFKGRLANAGMGVGAKVSLWVGNASDEASLVQIETPLVVTNDDFTIVHTFPAFDTTYYWQLRAAVTSAGGTATAETRTVVMSCQTLDTTTYTWTGAADDTWENQANWSDGNANGDSLGYPQSAAATVVLSAETTARLTVNKSMTIGKLDLSAAGASLTLAQDAAAGDAQPEITVNTLTFGNTRVRFAVDGVKLKSGAATLGSDCEVRLQNGASWMITGSLVNRTGGRLLLAPDTSLVCRDHLYLGEGLVEINDATVEVRQHSYIGDTRAGGVIRFVGTHPLYQMTNAGGHFRATLANSGVRLVFEIPVGGYATPPVQKTVNSTVIFGYNGNTSGQPITIDIAPDSPAKFTDANCETTLVSWPGKGIGKTLLVESALPDEKDAFVWSEEANPLTLGVCLVGSTHANELVVKGAPESFPCEALSPGYGPVSLALGETLTCTAPAEPVQLSETKRVTCVGWKLYRVDAATLARTLVDEGTTTSCTYTNTDGLWHDLVWQWKVEYRVTATSAGHGTVMVTPEWVETGKMARVKVTPDEGFGFGKWTGDVPAEHDRDHELWLTVRDRAYAFEASFLPAVYVRPNGSDDSDGKSVITAFRTIKRALQGDQAVYVLLADGTYEVTEQIVIDNGSTVAGESPDAKAVVKLMSKLPGGAEAPGSIFKLTHADARLYNLTITTDYDKNDSSKNAYDAARDGDFGRGVWLEKNGLVDNCVITNCRSQSRKGNGYGGGGVYLNGGGIVRGSLLTHNTAHTTWDAHVEGNVIVALDGGLVETCSILWGGTGLNTSSSSGVRVNGNGATIRNSLIAFCTHDRDKQKGSGVWVSNRGTVENCTVTGNFHPTSTKCPGLSAEGRNVVVRNCVIWGNVDAVGTDNWLAGSDSILTTTCTTPLMPGEGNIDDDPLFANAAAGDFHLGQLKAVDAGVAADWMDWTGDLDGNARVQGAAPDMGCYEMTPQTISCSFTVETRGLVDVDTVTLTARTAGTNLAGLSYEWTLTDHAGQTIVTNVTDAVLALPVPVGVYAVALKVTNGAGDTATMNRPDAFSVAPKDIYVALDGPGVYPYNSREMATSSIQAALDAAADGSVIHIAPGRYEPEDTLYVHKGVTLVSDEGPSKVEIFCAVKTTGKQIFSLNHPQAVLSGVTVTGRGADGERLLQWGAISMQAGVVTNCLITGHETRHNAGLPAACLLEGGTVVDCTISENRSRSPDKAESKGGSVRMDVGEDALLDRCTIIDNEATDGVASYGGGVYLTVGTIRNCFFARNLAHDTGGAIYLKGKGRVLGCTIVRNKARLSNGGIFQQGGTVRDCLFYANEAGDVVEDADDPGFVDAPNGDYHLNFASSAVDAAEGTDLGALDCDGNPRVSGSAADKGCYELDQDAFAIGISYEKLTPFAPGEVRFTVKTTVDDLDPEACWWTFDGSEPTAENHAATGLTVSQSFGIGLVTVRFLATYGGQTYAIDKSDWFRMLNEIVYVVAESTNPVYPYATRETATSDFDEAFAAVSPNGTILIDDGTYQLPRERTISLPMTIRSVNGPEKTILDAHKGFSPFVLKDPGAVLKDLTINNGRGWMLAGGVRIEAGGQLLNCTFNNCSSTQYAPGALLVKGPEKVLVRSCRFIGITVMDNNKRNGSVICVEKTASDVLIENCLVLDSREGQSDASWTMPYGDGAVWLEAGTLRNTVVAGSVLCGCGGIVVAGAASVENCTVINNVSTNEASSVAGIRVDSASAKVVNTLVWGNKWNDTPAEIGGTDGFEKRFDHCWTTGDPLLRGRGDYPYRPASASPCAEAGRPMSWMDDNVVDFYGRPRKQGRNPDIGAAESRWGGFTLILK